jgi:putative effector of murein hydrolase LrgA (UPF0299 family)
MKQKILDWVEKNGKLLMIIFLLVIPAIVGVVSATIGFLEKGFLGALAGLIRGIFFTFFSYLLIYLPIGAIYVVLSDKRSRDNLGCIIMGVILCAIGYFLDWLLTNY